MKPIHTITKESQLPSKSISAAKILNSSVLFWFTVAVIGQWIFAYYVASFYGGSALQGDFMKWNRVLPHGYAIGEKLNNIAVGTHLLFAVIIMIGGPLQFIPKLQNKAKSFHRWNGRIYVFTAMLTGLSGVVMIINHGTISGPVGDVSIIINAILILVCAILTWRTAVKRNLIMHRKWALRLFLVVNGVWFFRIGLMFWVFINGGPVGFDAETFRGPFLIFLGFGQYIIPLTVLELYFAAKKNKSSTLQYTTATLLLIITICTAIGIFAATAGMWLPRVN